MEHSQRWVDVGLVEDTSKTQAIVCANDHTTATQFKGELAGNWSDFELEFVSDEASTDWVAASLNRLLNACVNSNGSNLDTTLSQYLDWTSAIDYFIHTVVDKATDCVDKNYLLVTLDGTKWYFSVYDRDSIHGLAWDGSTLSRPVSNVNFSECASTNRVFELIYRFKTNELKSRYNALRLGELSESRIMQYFENFAWAIPSPVMLEDVKRWPSIPGSSVNTIDQIGRFVRQRLTQVDEWIASLPAQETPEAGEESSGYAVTNKLTGCKTTNSANTVEVGAPYTASITANSGYSLDGASVVITMGGTDVTSAYSGGTISIDSVTGTLVISITAVASVGVYTNQVPLSTDTDGSIYNGVGYKDNVRLSSSGSISGTAQTGSVTTGLIPIAFGDIIRMKGATWLGLTVSDGHYYIMFYDSNKTKLDGYACYTVDSSYAGVSVEYDEATGVTTWDTSKGTSGLLGNMPSVAYFRLNALGFGKDLIITVNEEIA